MGTVEIDTKKLDLNACINGVSPKHSEQVYFIRIGIINDYSPPKNEMQKYSDGRMIVTPPRLNGLRIKQQSFRQFTEQYKWNYILDNNVDEDHKDENDGEDDKDDSDVDNEDNATSSPKAQIQCSEGNDHTR